MGSGGGETVLPMVELVRGSLGLSIASHPLCPLPLQAPLAPPLTPRRPQLRQTYKNHSGPGPAWITSFPFRPVGE
jgi:hypothetical protein